MSTAPPSRLPWRHPTMLAPMEGVSHPVFRALLAERGGLGIVCTEFVRITDHAVTRKALQREVVRAPGTPLSVQVMGNHVEHMADAAGLMADLGADVVDINLGCPAPRVVRKGVGSAMLKDLALLERVVGAMRAQVPGMLSAKIRAGFDDKARVLDIGRAIEAAGADYLVVHPRRRADFYEGVADWRIIAALREALAIPVVGNGDCWYAVDAARMMRETGCDAVMIGRPALRNPWIFEQIDALARGEAPVRPAGRDVVAYFDTVVRRYRAAFGTHRGRPSDRAVVGKLKEWMTWIGRIVPDRRAFRAEVLRAPDVEGVLEGLARQLGHLPAERLDLQADGHLGLETSGSALAAVPATARGEAA